MANEAKAGSGKTLNLRSSNGSIVGLPRTADVAANGADPMMIVGDIKNTTTGFQRILGWTTNRLHRR